MVVRDHATLAGLWGSSCPSFCNDAVAVAAEDNLPCGLAFAESQAVFAKPCGSSLEALSTAASAMPCRSSSSRKTGRVSLQAMLDKFCGGSCGNLETARLAKAAARGASGHVAVAGPQALLEVPCTSNSGSRSATERKVSARTRKSRKVERAKAQMKFVDTCASSF